MIPRLRLRIAVSAALVAFAAGCTSGTTSSTQSDTSTTSAPVSGDAPDVTDADFEALQTRIRHLEQEVEALRRARGDDAASLTAEIDALRQRLYRWVAIADEFGEQAAGVDYWWSHAPVRGCGTDVMGPHTPDARDIRVGPVVFVAAREYADQPPEVFAPVTEDGYRRGNKLLVIVDEDTRVLLVVPPEARETVALGYGTWRVHHLTEADSPFTVAQGEPAVIFQECRPRPGGTQFDGGLLVAGPQCVPLDVYVEGASLPERVTIGFGVDCPST